MAERKVVRVTYLDHLEYSGEATLEELKRLKPIECVVIGEILHETKDHIIVLGHYEKRPKDLEGKPENYAMFVLKSTVVKREELAKK